MNCPLELQNYQNEGESYKGVSIQPSSKSTEYRRKTKIFVYIFYTGYGFITPQTPTGQVLCIFVCFIGIPINMLALKAVGELIAKWINAVVRRFERKILKRSEPLENMQRKTAVILFSLMMVLIVVNSVSLMHLVGWSLVEGVYFWFVTFTTIGFGDYVPHEPQRIKELSINSSDNHGNRVKNSIIVHNTFFTFYFILCLCIVSSVLNSIMAAIEERKCRPRCSGSVPRKTRDHPDNKENNTTGQRDTDTANFEMENMATMTEGNTTSLPTSKVE